MERIKKNNLASAVHSNEVELSWTPSTDGLVAGYNIIPDGVVVEGLLNEISLPDNMPEPLTTYQYSVVAVDDDVSESIPSNVEVTTLDGQPLPPIINRSDYVELLQHVFDIYTDNAYKENDMNCPHSHGSLGSAHFPFMPKNRGSVGAKSPVLVLLACW